MVWGDKDAFGPNVAKTAILRGPLPKPGGYVRLSLTACDSGVDNGKEFTGVRLAQSDGAAWWDRIGAVLSSPKASEDPLLSKEAWANALRRALPDFGTGKLRHDVGHLVRVSDTLRSKADHAWIERWFRDYVYAPFRVALEPEVNAARRLLAEQVHYETTLPLTQISRELAEPRAAHVLVRGQYDKPGEPVNAATPSFLPPVKKTGERVTRLDFARWLVSPEHPLTARVTVNRLWTQLFGAGLVRTPADFGSQGEPPTHPELLD